MKFSTHDFPQMFLSLKRIVYFATEFLIINVVELIIWPVTMIRPILCQWRHCKSQRLKSRSTCETASFGSMFAQRPRRWTNIEPKFCVS